MAKSIGFFVWLVSLTWVVQTAAHNLDTSYTQVKLSAKEIGFKFTFDLTTLLSIADLDPNQDRQVTRDEVLQAAPPVYQFLRERIGLALDSVITELGTEQPPEFPEGFTLATEQDYHQILIHFGFRKNTGELPGTMLLAFAIFDVFGTRHVNLASIEQGDHREEAIVFSRLEPDYLYDTSVHAPIADLLMKFLRLGVKHIFLGYDHILFLLALIVVSRFWDLVKVVTAFTVAHTITLILAALELVRLPGSLIETGIAATIMYVAAENLWAKEPRRRWLLTFCFGLVHGFGFANVLSELGLPSKGVIQCLVSFNVGVELGQIAIVLLLLPISLWLGKQSFAKGTRSGLSILIFAFGLAWFIERAFGLNLMPV